MLLCSDLLRNLCFRLSHKMVEADTSNQIWARDYITITAHSNNVPY
jgi:hypothetical protein